MSPLADLSPALVPVESNGLLFFRFRSAAGTTSLRHAISTRRGGTSAGPLASCNLGLPAAEPPEVTLANRLALARAAGIQSDRWVLGEQVHGAGVARVGTADCGRGARDPGGRLPATDALVTTEPGVALAVLGADCGLVLLWAPGGRALAVAHAGWRGLAAGVLARTVEATCRAASVAPGELRAGVAPAIGACCYRVGPEVREALTRAPSEMGAAFEERAGNLWLDVGRACVLQLLSAGLREEQVAPATVCTACRRDLFYSARAEGEPTGRFALVAMWEQTGRPPG